jgi:hypothetical protein
LGARRVDAMNKMICAIVAAALLGGVALVLTGLSGEVEASTPQAAVKGDRLDARTYGTACSQRGWPYYEATCLRNTTTPTREVRQVRIVTTDRLVEGGALRMR